MKGICKYTLPVYHFTPDYYNGKPSWTGGYVNHILDCYSIVDEKPFDRYALTLDGTVLDLEKRVTLLA